MSAWQDKSGPCRSTSEANSSGVRLLRGAWSACPCHHRIRWLLKRPPVAAEKTTAASAVVEPPYDGGLVTEPARVDRAGEPDVTYMVQKVANEGAGIVNVIRSRNSVIQPRPRASQAFDEARKSDHQTTRDSATLPHTKPIRSRSRLTRRLEPRPPRLNSAMPRAATSSSRGRKRGSAAPAWASNSQIASSAISTASGRRCRPMKRKAGGAMEAPRQPIPTCNRDQADRGVSGRQRYR